MVDAEGEAHPRDCPRSRVLVERLSAKPKHAARRPRADDGRPPLRVVEQTPEDALAPAQQTVAPSGRKPVGTDRADVALGDGSRRAQRGLIMWTSTRNEREPA